jgi:hypothetical protein
MFRVISIIGLLLAVVLGLVSLLGSSRPGGQRIAGWQRFIYALTMLAGAALALTGLGISVVLGQAMHGWWLMLHASAAPAFAVGLVAVVVCFAHQCRFNDGGSTFSAWQKFLFWVMAGAGLVVILSAVVPMTPLFGTPVQNLLPEVHRYSSLVLAMAAIAQAGRFVKA